MLNIIKKILVCIAFVLIFIVVFFTGRTIIETEYQGLSELPDGVCILRIHDDESSLYAYVATFNCSDIKVLQNFDRVTYYDIKNIDVEPLSETEWMKCGKALYYEKKSRINFRIKRGCYFLEYEHRSGEKIIKLAYKIENGILVELKRKSKYVEVEY